MAYKRPESPGEKLVDLLQRSWLVLRQFGIKAFVFRIIGELGYRRLYLLEKHLAVNDPVVSSKIPLRFHIWTREQLADYMHLRPDSDENEIRARFDRHHLCYVAFYDSQAVGVCWAALHYPWVKYLKIVLPFPNSTAYCYDAFVIPARRGQSITPALGSYMSTDLGKRGVDRLIRATLPENYPALRAHQKLGFHVYGLQCLLFIGPLKFRYFKAMEPSFDNLITRNTRGLGQ